MYSQANAISIKAITTQVKGGKQVAGSGINACINDVAAAATRCGAMGYRYICGGGNAQQVHIVAVNHYLREHGVAGAGRTVRKVPRP